MLGMPTLAPSTIDERIRKTCQLPKTNSIFKYLMGGSAAKPLVPESLPVDAYVEITKEWSTVGTEPWLDTDDGDASYITVNSTLKTMSYFTFENTTLGSFSQVLLQWKSRYTGGAGWWVYAVYLWDGAWQYLTDVTQPVTSYETLTQDVTSYLTTQVKVNAARVYFYSKPDVYDYGRITYARLYVTP